MNFYSITIETDYNGIVDFCNRTIALTTGGFSLIISGTYIHNESSWFVYNPNKTPFYPAAAPKHSSNDCLKLFGPKSYGTFKVVEMNCSSAYYSLFEFQRFIGPLSTTICNVTKDVVSSSGDYIKTICLVRAYANQENATNLAAANGMYLYAITTEDEHSAVLNFCNSTFATKDKLNLRINGKISVVNYYVSNPDRGLLYSGAYPTRQGLDCLQIYQNATSGTYYVAELNCTDLVLFSLFEYVKPNQG